MKPHQKELLRTVIVIGIIVVVLAIIGHYLNP